MNYFYVSENDEKVWIQWRSDLPFTSIRFFIDQIEVSPKYHIPGVFEIKKEKIQAGSHVLTIKATIQYGNQEHLVSESYIFQGPKQKREGARPDFERTFLPGDILIASDNVNGLPPGYMGHSALVINSTQLIESVMKDPSIYQDSIEQFISDHPHHAHYRPKSAEMGQRAAEWAKSYLQEYQTKKKNGINKPKFNFGLSYSLDDPWETIYCSKLVRLAYLYGANYKLPNDYLWFAPQDLEEVLSQDSNFETVYKHPEFKFKIDV